MAVYGLLLELYPPQYLQQHRAEMLQNFEDLDHAASSKAMLWFFIARDLAASLTEEHMKSLNSLPAYVIGVLIAWAAIFAVGEEFRATAAVREAVSESSYRQTLSATPV